MTMNVVALKALLTTFISSVLSSVASAVIIIDGWWPLKGHRPQLSSLHLLFYFEKDEREERRPQPVAPEGPWKPAGPRHRHLFLIKRW